jgi:uncharacterized protein (DUF697 family)
VRNWYEVKGVIMNEASSAVSVENQEGLTPSEREKRRTRANNIVINGVSIAFLLGLIFTLLVSSLLVVGVQLKMINELCAEYGVKFSKQVGKAIIASLMGWLLTGVLGQVGTILAKLTLLELLGGKAGLAIVSGAATYAIGQVFIQHFESGGTLLDFDAEKSKKYYLEMYEEGKKVVKTSGKKAATAS